MKRLLLFIILFVFWKISMPQSFEVMSGTKRLFKDAQYLKFFDTENKVSLFSRARATAEYNEQKTDLFTGAYLNYTTQSGFGGTILGRIASNNSGIDAGIHYFKATNRWMIYALPSINLKNELLYSWFSILRFTPELKKEWRLYSSIELFSAFDQIGHLSSVQRIRLGVEKNTFQFGLAVNYNHSRYSSTDLNPGIFFRKQFK